jgi:hypothetical protein
MLSRREWGAGTGEYGRVERTAETPSGKVTKEVAKYQAQPNNMQMCGMCKFYIPSGGKAGSGMMGGQMMGQDHMGGMMGGQKGGMLILEGRNLQGNLMWDWLIEDAPTHRIAQKLTD